MARLERTVLCVQHELLHGTYLDRLASVYQGLTAQAAAPLLRRQRREGYATQALPEEQQKLHFGVEGESLQDHLRSAGEADQEGRWQPHERASDAVLEPLSKGERAVRHGQAPSAA
jgi:hypothetical protein